MLHSRALSRQGHSSRAQMTHSYSARRVVDRWLLLAAASSLVIFGAHRSSASRAFPGRRGPCKRRLIAHGLGASTIAEFVGDDATVQLLRELGVDHGQGYHLGKRHSTRRSRTSSGFPPWFEGHHSAGHTAYGTYRGPRRRRGGQTDPGGSDVVMMAYAPLRHGPERIRETVDGLESWLTSHEYTSLEQAKGSLSQKAVPDPTSYERANYMRTLVSYSPDW